MSRYLAIDLGGTHVRTAISDAEGSVAGRCDEPTDHSEGPESVIRQIVRLAELSAREAGTALDTVQRAAIATPGPVDVRTGTVHSPPNMPGWGDVPLQHALQSHLNMPVAVENDANAGAMGEWRYGAGRGAKNLVYITVSTGIGGGVIEAGRLVEGASGAAGEVGHMTIDRNGPVCKCGNIGCLEMYASGTSIARRFREAVESGKHSIVEEWMGNRPVRAEDVARAAREGDGTALEVFSDAASALGTGVVNVLHLYNPEIVIIGGGVAEAGDLLFEPVRRVVERHAMPIARRDGRIVPALLGPDVGLRGAIALAIHGRG